MFYPTTYPLPQTWFANFRQWLRQWLAALTPASATQILLQPGDSYHLDAGHHHLRVLTGTLWAPGVGIFSAGEQLTLSGDAAGLAIHTYGQQAVVFTQRAA